MALTERYLIGGYHSFAAFYLKHLKQYGYTTSENAKTTNNFIVRALRVYVGL